MKCKYCGANLEGNKCEYCGSRTGPDKAMPPADQVFGTSSRPSMPPPPPRPQANVPPPGSYTPPYRSAPQSTPAQPAGHLAKRKIIIGIVIAVILMSAIIIVSVMVSVFSNPGSHAYVSPTKSPNSTASPSYSNKVSEYSSPELSIVPTRYESLQKTVYDVYITGTLINNSNQKVSVFIYYNILDAQGKVISTAVASNTNFGPGSKWEYTVHDYISNGTVPVSCKLSDIKVY